MPRLLSQLVLVVTFLPLATPVGYSQTNMGQSAPIANQVTLEGCLLCDWVTLPRPKTSYGPPPLDPEHLFAIYALDGTPEIRASVEQVIDECYPEKALDGDGAKNLQDQFTRRLKYFVSPDSPVISDMLKNLHSYECHGIPYALTGTLSEQNGRKWITVQKYVSLPKLKYPGACLTRTGRSHRLARSLSFSRSTRP